MAKLIIKSADREFTLEGDDELIAREFRLLLKSRSSTQTVIIRGDGAPIPTEDLDRAMEREFDIDQDGHVTLSGTPQGESKTEAWLLMVLFGYQELQGRKMVHSSDLLTSARKAGCHVDRLDRALSSAIRDADVVVSGAKKGKRYGLTPAGSRRARMQLIDRFFPIEPEERKIDG